MFNPYAPETELEIRWNDMTGDEIAAEIELERREDEMLDFEAQFTAAPEVEELPVKTESHRFARQLTLRAQMILNRTTCRDRG